MIHGYVHDDFRSIADQLEKQLRAAGSWAEGGRVGGGAAVCVYHRGEKVVDAWAGARNAEGQAWEADTMAMSFSTTKGVMATAVHTLVDRKLLDYDDPVAKVWPEFARAGKSAITLRQVLSHQAGLYPIRSLIDHAERIFDWEYMADRLASATPVAESPGRSGYHGITYGWLVGEIIKRVTQAKLSEAMRQVLFAPLGMVDGAFLGAPTTERGRVAELVKPSWRKQNTVGRFRFWMARQLCRMFGLDPDMPKEALMPLGFREVYFSDRILDAEVPSMNGVFTARSLARMYSMLANGGELDGTRFLSEETIRRATQIQTRSFDAVVGFPMRWRLGYHLVGTSRGVLPNAFGHFGYGGSGAWADPDRHLSVAMVLNRVAGTPFGDMRMVRMGGVAAAAAERKRRGS